MRYQNARDRRADVEVQKAGSRFSCERRFWQRRTFSEASAGRRGRQIALAALSSVSDFCRFWVSLGVSIVFGPSKLVVL